MKIIWLTKGQFTLVDDQDFDYLNQWEWSVNKSGGILYANRSFRQNGKKIMLMMHRIILGITDLHILGDHIDRNGLNNQRYNLRIATHSQNSSNKKSYRTGNSKFLGVFWRERYKCFVAAIGKNGKKIHVGHYKTENEAAEAYNKKASELHGEFANLNIISWSANGKAE